MGAAPVPTLRSGEAEAWGALATRALTITPRQLGALQAAPVPGDDTRSESAAGPCPNDRRRSSRMPSELPASAGCLGSFLPRAQWQFVHDTNWGWSRAGSWSPVRFAKAILALASSAPPCAQGSIRAVAT